MIYRVLWILLFILIRNICLAQNDIAELIEFSSEREERIFIDILLDTQVTDIEIEYYFDLFLLTNSGDTNYVSEFKKELEGWASSLKANKKYLKKDEKKASLIHEFLHENIFSKYVFEATPELISAKGEYNCVTATGVVYYLAHLLELSCAIQEEPNHVYPRLEIRDNSYSLEMTDPSMGYVKYLDSYKEQIVQQLKDGKLIDVAEYEGKSNVEIFSIIYEQSRELDLKELIAIQYNNQYFFEVQRHQNVTISSIMNSAKAYALSKSEVSRLGLISALNMYLLQSKFTSAEDLNVVKLLAHADLSSSNEVLLSSLYHLFSREMVINNPRIDDFKEVSQYLLENISDTILNKELTYSYHAYLSVDLNTKGNYIEAKSCIERALEIKPNQMELLHDYTNTLHNISVMNSDNDSLILSLANKFYAYPRLKESMDFKSMATKMLYRKVVRDLQKRSLPGCRKSLKDLEDLLSEIGHDAIPAFELASLYNAVSVLSFEKNYTSLAKKMVKRAIEIDPNNMEHKDLLRVYNY